MAARQLAITARAPATIANVGPGFDVLGFALHAPEVRVEVERGKHGITLSSDVPLPTAAGRNTAGAAILALCKHLGERPFFRVRITAGIPIGSGLGSSAGSAAAAVVAINALLGSPLAPEALLPFAMAGEAIAGGVPHADNVCPALCGGFTIVRSHAPCDWTHVPAPANLNYVVVHPACAVSTAEARRVLPKTIALHDGVRQWAQVAALVAGICRGEFALIGRALDDPLIEPIRGALIPGYAAVKAAALKAGALGCSIAGSGPSMFAFVEGTRVGAGVGKAMQRAFAKAGLKSTVWTGRIANDGARVL